jgi:hypothetical protein
VHWQYRTILFEFRKDGLLGDKYIDDEDVEATLNEQGAAGWELVNVAMIQEGLLAFFKRPLSDAPAVMEEKISVAAAPAAPEPAPAPAADISLQPAGEPLTAEALKEQEREHIRRLESRRREAMSALDDDMIGNIRIS